MKLTRLNTLHFIGSNIHFYKRQGCLCSFKRIRVYMIRLFSSEHMWHLPTKHRHGESSIKFLSQ